MRKSSPSSPEPERLAYYEQLWSEGGFRFWLGNYEDMFTDAEANREAYAFWRDKVRERIDDPAVAELLAPTESPHPFGVKRPCLEQWYYDLFNEDHVELVDVNTAPIERVTERGVVAGGREFEFDVLEVLPPADAAGLARYLASGAFPGIGEVLAGRIVDELGADALQVIQDRPDRLERVQGLRAPAKLEV